MTLPTPKDALNLRGGPTLIRRLAWLLLASSLLLEALQIGFLHRIRPAAFVATLAGVAMLVLLRLGRVRWAAWVFPCTLVVATPVAASQVAGVHSAVWALLPLATVLAGWMLGRRQAYGFALAGLTGLGLVWVFRIHGVEAEPAVPGVYAVLYGAICVMGTVMGTATSHSFDQQLDRVTELSQALQRANESLEARVAERTQALQAANEALGAAKLEAEAAARAKAAFLANMSHEIRTPLNAIHGLGHLLQQTPLEAVQRAHVGQLQQAAGHLLGIVNDILDLSKADAGRMTLAMEPFRLETVLARVRGLIGDAAARKGLALTCRCEADVPALLIGDALRLGQVLVNLGHNAVKFTDRGHVDLHIRVLARETQTVRLHFAVRDTGIGIPREDQGRLFQEFEQVDSSPTRRHGGTGLGLAISRQLVGLMGGEIGVDSVPGQGACFWFTAKLGLVQAEAMMGPHDTAPARPVGDGARRLQGRRLLLAEDNPVNQLVAAELLRRAGAQVDVAENGREAVAMARAGSHDLVLMDMQMPELDGVQATQALRQHLDACRLPIIAMSASVLAEDRQRCLEAGMNDFVAKPFDPEALFAVVERWCSPRAVRASASDLEGPRAQLADHMVHEAGDA
ncbi:response regulator [Ideonella sp. B7]|uniref:ATP-binding protein n=1 Tax=Ideonella benzenivorans TaxID=2831643 RepID=UPI001CEC2F87|nr:ATP-binding protein [Ideonella benzenivorans]MCA6216722.1 response regulator [Ideonella benzenivorans]